MKLHIYLKLNDAWIQAQTSGHGEDIANAHQSICKPDFAIWIIIHNFATTRFAKRKANKTPMDHTLADRLKSFIATTEYNNSQFADKAGIPRPSLSQILSGRNKKVSNQVLELIHDSFPELSMMWLVFGEGPMLAADAILQTVNDDISKRMQSLEGEEQRIPGESPDGAFQQPTHPGTASASSSNHPQQGELGVSELGTTPLWPSSGTDGGIGIAADYEEAAEYHKSGYQNPENTTSGSFANNQSNHNALTNPSSSTYRTVGQNVALETKIRELQMQLEETRTELEEIRRRPRKVSQITIYYDDSTFETFVPGGPHA